MKELHVPEITGQSRVAAPNIPALLDEHQIKFQPVSCVNWKDYPYCPEVAFRIAHTGDFILLNYRVKEESVRAIAAEDNGRVWEDSCCEFSSSFRKIRKKTCIIILNATAEVPSLSVADNQATDLMLLKTFSSR